MRGWKPISIVQIQGICKFNTYDKAMYNGLRCEDIGNYCFGHLCAPSICTRWRKLGSADIKVSKITANNKQITPCCPECGTVLVHTEDYCPNSKCKF